MLSEIFIADSDEDIESCFSAFSVLRPNLQQKDFLMRVRRQQAESYKILALRHEGVIKSAAGFRFQEYLAFGKILYIDDLTTLPNERGQGWATLLLEWLIAHAKEHECAGVHLDSGYGRHVAHRLYLRNGLHLSCHHFALNLEESGG